MKLIKQLFRPIIFVVAIALLIGITWALAAPDWAIYTSRVLTWGFSDIHDYEKFPSRIVNNAAPTFFFKQGTTPASLATIEYRYKGQVHRDGFDQFLESTGTTAFIVIRDDTIVYEKYFNGYQRDSINTSFSAAKSFVSTLVGIAIDEGFIGSVDYPITMYLPELRGRGFDDITIRHLLKMSSGIKYQEFPFLNGDDAKTYYFPDLRWLALKDTSVTGPPGQQFLYNNYHPLLLGLILERATHQSVAGYLEQKIWKPLGMEFPASWSLDSAQSGFEKMESGINARAIDFAKFGRLLLNKGNWNGEQIVSETWVNEATLPASASPQFWNISDWAQSERVYYGYMWYARLKQDGSSDFWAWGRYGQLIYIAPQDKIVIVRFGSQDGAVDSWPDILQTVVNMIK
jgi:CubicO group peptidase (beta-lactamase class C family)